MAFSFDSDLHGSGADAVATGPITYVPGMSGSAVRIPLGSIVDFPGTGSMLRAATALTVSVWTRSVIELGPVVGRRYFISESDTFTAGLMAYVGDPGVDITSCIGAASVASGVWGGCGTVPACNGVFHHYVLRWEGAGATPQAATDGGPWVDIAGWDGRAPPGDEPLDTANDIWSGGLATEWTGATGSIELDDFRIYDTAIPDDELWRVTACPAP